MLPQIQIVKGHNKRFINGSPWLFNNEIVQSSETKALAPGALVQVVFNSKPIAVGYFNKHSLISFRTLSWEPNQQINADFFCARLQNALTLRENFYDQPYYRLIHAEADQLPGLIIDRFGSVFVVQINTQGMENLEGQLLDALQTLFNPTTIYVKKDSTIRTAEGLAILEPNIIGEAIDTLTVLENSAKFQIDISTGQKTSWFYDHRDNRRTIAALAKGKTVIDYFCYSGGFSIQAALHGAKSVIGVDRSLPAITNAINSAKLNNTAAICKFVTATVFEDLDTRIQNKETFDIVILDPPAFVKVKKDLTTGIKGYEKLITKGLQLVTSQGLLLIASCSYHLKDTDLKACVARALHNTGKTGRIIHRLAAGVDHPANPYIEESEYLKGFLVFVN